MVCGAFVGFRLAVMAQLGDVRNGHSIGLRTAGVYVSMLRSQHPLNASARRVVML